MCSNQDKYKIITDHYNKIAKKHGASSDSTMEDKIIRDKEVTLICNFIRMLKSEMKDSKCKILDVGCGNGFTLNILSEKFSQYKFYGVDLTDELIKIAKSRELENALFQLGDVRSLPYEDGFFDIIFTERCLINILSREEQQKGLFEIARVLKPKGYYLMIEAFSDGLENNNKARTELGLDEIKVAYHNLYFNYEEFLIFIKKYDLFTQVNPLNYSLNKKAELFQSNFLSSHYFFARVLHPLITKGDTTKKNTEFIKFFSNLPPYGNYSPIKAYILKKN